MLKTPSIVTISLVALVSVLGLAGLTTVGFNLLSSPQPYPHASRSAVRAPVVALTLRKDCGQWTLITKSLYTAPQSEVQVIGWFRSNGWMQNYKFEDSVLRQTDRQWAGVGLATAQEIHVENAPGGPQLGAHLVSTTQMTVSIGKC